MPPANYFLCASCFLCPTFLHVYGACGFFFIDTFFNVGPTRFLKLEARCPRGDPGSEGSPVESSRIESTYFRLGFHKLQFLQSLWLSCWLRYRYYTTYTLCTQLVQYYNVTLSSST
ncbi:uncharacterized protein F4812DRAFT_319691 [Daldinia caldariorum]|uniref:uncharacterized protein n=1 Tax=Daldinia caldariorum TaxID=326644 RepID=UPI002007F5EF|nr:uncharacterized protein F4812DRAFT_319691 [Daldinia caldariorum]KAI1469115.1 hypothetical protein F4812DRAFT_319691 [Daldinia caldariorum]